MHWRCVLVRGSRIAKVELHQNRRISISSKDRTTLAISPPALHRTGPPGKPDSVYHHYGPPWYAGFSHFRDDTCSAYPQQRGRLVGLVNGEGRQLFCKDGVSCSSKSQRAISSRRWDDYRKLNDRKTDVVCSLEIECDAESSCILVEGFTWNSPSRVHA